MVDFEKEMTRASMMRDVETDPDKKEYWSWYIRGLRRNHHGERFCTEVEHQVWIAAAMDTDRQRHARGMGYLDGLKVKF